MKKLIVLIIAFSGMCFSQVQVAPFLTPNQQFFDSTGAPLAGGKVCTFAALTTTPQASYSEATGTTLNPNPILLDSGGRASIFLTTAAYKIVVAASTANSQCSPAITSADNVTWNNLAQVLTSLTVTGPATIKPVTAATSLANQSSPAFCIQGFYFNVTSLTDQYCLSDVLGSGTNPTNTFTISHSGSSGTSALNFTPPLTFSNITVSGTATVGSIVNNGSETVAGSLTANGNASSGNVALKSSSTDHLIHLSSAGNDGNDGLSWGTAKLTAQAAFNAATTSGTNPGAVMIACGTYVAPTTWYSNLDVDGICPSDAAPSANYGTAPLTAAAGVKFTIAPSTIITLTSIQNTFVRNVYFDAANGGGAMVLNSVSGLHFDDITLNQGGNSTTPVLLLTTIDGSGPTHNTVGNVFRGMRIVANNSGSNATCLQLLGKGTVNAGAGVTDNYFYDLRCFGGILHAVDFEKNSDSNYIYGLQCNQDLPGANSSCLSFNEITPASDQDANAEVVMGACITGTFSAQIRAGQTNGSQIQLCTGSSGLPPQTILGGSPSYDILTVGLDGVTKATQYSGTLGVTASAALGVPSGAVAGDFYVARGPTVGVVNFGTDNSAILRNGGYSFSNIASGTITNVPNVNTADSMGLVPVVGTPLHLTGLNAATTATSIGTIGTNIITGTYLAHVSCITTTSGTGTTAVPSLTWNDTGGGKTLPLASFALNSTTITGYDNAVFPIHPTSGAINLAVTGTFGTSVYACDAWLTREN